MVLRHTGQYEEGCCFAVLIVNLFSTLLDRACWSLSYAVRAHRQNRKGGAAV
jgi:Na+-translocating ferredoxin:NAD+ oxidoreductase RnfD subunit